MATDEFSLIRRHFSAIGKPNPHIRLGIGDDAAVCAIPPRRLLVMSIDTLIGGVHFPSDTAPADIAYKALAVNLSDLAAMAAEPAWFLMSLSLPEADDAWLEQFAAGLSATAEQFKVQLIGGDTCRGPLSITIQINGLVPEQEYVTRAGAGPGDLIVVSGTLGDAALGLAQLQGRVELPDDLAERCVNALLRPRPRVELAAYLRRFATAAIDISDGLQADLGHVLESSGCGAVLDRDRLPVNGWIRQTGAYGYALGGGDDYEICCCISADDEDSVADWNRQASDCPLTVVGEIGEAGYLLRQPGEPVDLKQQRGYRHFG